jgi:hypothetical protein
MADCCEHGNEFSGSIKGILLLLLLLLLLSSSSFILVFINFVENRFVSVTNESQYLWRRVSGKLHLPFHREVTQWRQCVLNRPDFSAWKAIQFFGIMQGLATGWTTGVRFPSKAGIMLLTTTVSRPTLRSPVQWVPASILLEVKRPEGEADHLSPTVAKFKNA